MITFLTLIFSKKLVDCLTVVTVVPPGIGRYDFSTVASLPHAKRSGSNRSSSGIDFNGLQNILVALVKFSQHIFQHTVPDWPGTSDHEWSSLFPN